MSVYGLRRCGSCGSPGHRRPTCPGRKAPAAPGPLTPKSQRDREWFGKAPSQIAVPARPKVERLW